jgi:serine/threonine-protein kinase
MFARIKNIFSHGILSRYTMERAVGRHSFFTLHAGRDKRTMRPVTIKDYTPEGMEIEAKLDRMYRTRPLVDVLPQLKNPHIVTTIEAQAGKDRRLEVLEHLAAPTLREVLDRGGLTPADFKPLAISVASGLSYLHSLGFVHRGLAPEGIAVADGGQAKVIDLSLLMDQSRCGPNGTTVGPVGYLAPEVIARRGCDVRSDVYALGAVCYEILSGVHVFPNARGYEGLVRMMNTSPPALRERGADVPADLEAVIMKAVEKNPRDRFQTMGDLLVALMSAPAPHTLKPGTHVHAPAFAA